MHDIETIKNDLKKLKLHYLAENLLEFTANAKKDNLPIEEVIRNITILEQIEKARRTSTNRVKSARIGKFKAMGYFDYGWPTSINKQMIEDALTLNFIEKSENLILMGPAGLGKTMIAKNIAWQTANSGKSALFVTASELVTKLLASGVLFESKIRAYTRPDLLVIDEMGYLGFEIKAADVLFEVISRRYEQGSIVMTTNLAFKDWGNIFPGASCVTAMLDRLIHHSKIIQVTGASYRQNEKLEKRKKAKK